MTVVVFHATKLNLGFGNLWETFIVFYGVQGTHIIWERIENRLFVGTLFVPSVN